VFEKIKEDTNVFKARHKGNKGFFKYIYYPDYRMILLIRFSQWLYKYKFLKPLSFLTVMLNDFISGIWVGPRVEIGVGAFFGHSRGLIFNPNAKIGKYCSFLNQVTLGGPNVEVGDYVEVGAGAMIISTYERSVIIGSYSLIGAGAVVTKSVPPFSVVAGVPAKIIKTISIEEWEKAFPQYEEFPKNYPEIGKV